MRERWTVRWFRKRAILYHLIVAALAPGCLLAGWWQIDRAEGGNTLSYLYAVEWPIFAVLSIVGWWQLIHEDPAAVDSRKVERARRAVNRGPFVPPPPDTASGFSVPFASGRYGALHKGPSSGPPGHDQPGWPSVDGEEVTLHALSTYNAHLARLSAGGGRKSWRNPHGLSAGVGQIDSGGALDPGLPGAYALEERSQPEVTPGPGGVTASERVTE